MRRSTDRGAEPIMVPSWRPDRRMVVSHPPMFWSTRTSRAWSESSCVPSRPGTRPTGAHPHIAESQEADMRQTLNRMKVRGEDDRGVTMIELLVVVVIIGGLVAMPRSVYLNYRKGAANKSAASTCAARSRRWSSPEHRERERSTRPTRTRALLRQQHNDGAARRSGPPGNERASTSTPTGRTRPTRSARGTSTPRPSILQQRPRRQRQEDGLTSLADRATLPPTDPPRWRRPPARRYD